MVFVASDTLRKYLAFENGEWIHDPNMPIELEEEFENFVKAFKKMKKEEDMSL